MKRTVAYALAAGLCLWPVTTKAQSQTNNPNVFGFDDCVEVMAIGTLFGCLISCVWHGWGQDNGDMYSPPDPPRLCAPPQIGQPVQMMLQAGSAYVTCSSGAVTNWTLPDGSQVKCVWQTTLQAAPTVTGPYTNFCTLTFWKSTTLTQAAISDASNRLIASTTNAPGHTNGVAFSVPPAFYRCCVGTTNGFQPIVE